jgi:hypothetical protein
MSNWMEKESQREKHAGTKGIFKRAAERQGKSTHELAEDDKHKSGKMGARARMALAFASARR